MFPKKKIQNHPFNMDNNGYMDKMDHSEDWSIPKISLREGLKKWFLLLFSKFSKNEVKAVKVAGLAAPCDVLAAP